MTRTPFLQPLLVASLVTACGGGGSPEPTTPAPSGASAARAAPSNGSAIVSTPPHEHRAHAGPPRPWAELSYDERRRYMGQEVLPVMAEEFALYDASRYADFGCESCHGAGAEARRYAMPNPELLTLYPTGSPEQQAMLAEHPRMTRFMFNHVVWNMQRLLGAAEFDPATQQGFSCYACHPAGAAASRGPSAAP